MEHLESRLQSSRFFVVGSSSAGDPQDPAKIQDLVNSDSAGAEWSFSSDSSNP